MPWAAASLMSSSTGIPSTAVPTGTRRRLSAAMGSRRILSYVVDAEEVLPPRLVRGRVDAGGPIAGQPLRAQQRSGITQLIRKCGNVFATRPDHYGFVRADLDPQRRNAVDSPFGPWQSPSTTTTRCGAVGSFDRSSTSPSASRAAASDAYTIRAGPVSSKACGCRLCGNHFNQSQWADCGQSRRRRSRPLPDCAARHLTDDGAHKGTHLHRSPPMLTAAEPRSAIAIGTFDTFECVPKKRCSASMLTGSRRSASR